MPRPRAILPERKLWWIEGHPIRVLRKEDGEITDVLWIVDLEQRTDGGIDIVLEPATEEIRSGRSLLRSRQTTEALRRIPRFRPHVDKHGKLKQPPGRQEMIPQAVVEYIWRLWLEPKPDGRYLSQRDICHQLDTMGIPPPMGGQYWERGSIRRQLQRLKWMVSEAPSLAQGFPDVSRLDSLQPHIQKPRTVWRLHEEAPRPEPQGGGPFSASRAGRTPDALGDPD